MSIARTAETKLILDSVITGKNLPTGNIQFTLEQMIEITSSLPASDAECLKRWSDQLRLQLFFLYGDGQEEQRDRVIILLMRTLLTLHYSTEEQTWVQAKNLFNAITLRDRLPLKDRVFMASCQEQMTDKESKSEPPSLFQRCFNENRALLINCYKKALVLQGKDIATPATNLLIQYRSELLPDTLPEEAKFDKLYSTIQVELDKYREQRSQSYLPGFFMSLTSNGVYEWLEEANRAMEKVYEFKPEVSGCAMPSPM